MLFGALADFCLRSRRRPDLNMAKRLTPNRLRARANAFEEAAEHLTLSWTDDPVERAEGDALTQAFRVECERLRALANARESGIAPLRQPRR